MSSTPSYFRGVNVHLESAKWDEIQNLISRLNEMTGHKYRLPTEAEWEFAARGGNLSCDYRYSGSNNPDEVAWYAADSLEQMQPVGKKKPNELGLYDMSGNAFEWCNDWYGPYGEEHQIDPRDLNVAPTTCYGEEVGNRALMDYGFPFEHISPPPISTNVVSVWQKK